ncbi:BQ2448_3842 [Microbotryum intermedium]|uniref:BQ2448_3842 protein n=1 Tax=Microbotryum intermedium TaxID=269621 RepID=A0A238FGI9_9BASI|nr:BQ2448_3842 [Microbotryum intermedium]
MFHMYVLAGCVTVGVICLVAYELDQHMQANQRRREEEARQNRMRHSYTRAPRFHQVDDGDDDDEVKGESSAIEAYDKEHVGDDKSATIGTGTTMGSTGLHKRRRSANRSDAEQRHGHALATHPSLFSHRLDDSTAANAFLSDSCISSSASNSAYLTSHSPPSHFLTPTHHLTDCNSIESDRQIFTRHARHNSMNNDDDASDSASDSATEPLFERASSRGGAKSPDEDWVRL